MHRLYQCLCLYLILVSSGYAGELSIGSQAAIADQLEKIQTSEVSLFLYSLDPRAIYSDTNEYSGPVYHNFPILGFVEISETREKMELLQAFADGVRANSGGAAKCFEPRHGLRVVGKSGTNDFLICFTCWQVHSFGFGSDSAQYFSITRSPRATFDKYLDKYKIPKAK